MRWLKLYIIVLFTAVNLSLAAQSKVHVFTRTIAENFKYNKGDVIKINAFQADIMITGWHMDSVAIILRLIAKSTDYDQASKEIANWAYAMKKENTELVLKNYLKRDISQHSSTNLTAQYNIRVPENCLIHLSNFSGTTNMRKLEGVFITNIKYGSIALSDMKGIVESNMEVSDIHCRNSNVLLKVTSKHTAIYLDKVEGDITVNAQYGSVRINEVAPFKKLTMDITRADVYMVKKSLSDYRLDLTSFYGKINIDIPDYIKEMDLYNIEESTDHTRVTYKAGISVPLISITNKYGNIVLN